MFLIARAASSISRRWRCCWSVHSDDCKCMQDVGCAPSLRQRCSERQRLVCSAFCGYQFLKMHTIHSLRCFCHRFCCCFVERPYLHSHVVYEALLFAQCSLLLSQFFSYSCWYDMISTSKRRRRWLKYGHKSVFSNRIDIKSLCFNSRTIYLRSRARYYWLHCAA